MNLNTLSPAAVSLPPRALACPAPREGRRTRLWLLSLSLGLGLLTLASPGWAMWKWIDRDGKVQYSDMPPPLDTPPDKVLIRGSGNWGGGAPAPTADPAGNASQPSLVEQVEAKKKAEEAKKKAEEEAKRKEIEAQNAKIREQNCAEARRVSATLKASGGRIASVNEKGERVFLDDKQFAARQQQAEDMINKSCNAPPPAPAAPPAP